MASIDTDLSEREERLGAIVFACIRALEEGRPPGRAELLARHPEFAAELAEFFTDRDRVDGLAAPLRLAARAALLPTQRPGVTAPPGGDGPPPPGVAGDTPSPFG